MAIKKVLIVDDSPTERYALSEILTANGFEVSTAEDGSEVPAKIKSANPDLILMDVVMPGQNGFQVTRALSKDEATKHIPVIICSTKDQETDKVWGLRQGARDYVTKPVDAAELLAKIRAI